jgi:hypothetical protein
MEMGGSCPRFFLFLGVASAVADMQIKPLNAVS